jgi:hypothetical protein
MTTRALPRPTPTDTDRGECWMSEIPGAEDGVLVIYGASDDLIEVVGLLDDELNPPYGKPAVVSIRVDDASFTSLHVEYDPDGTGEWRIQPTSLGSLVTIVPARGEGDGDDEHGCPGYSDKAVIDMAGIEARRINVSVIPPTSDVTP